MGVKCLGPFFKKGSVLANIKCYSELRCIPSLSPQSAVCGFLAADDDKAFLILNHILLLFKYRVYISRSSNVFSFKALLKSIMKAYKLEKILSQNDERKIKLFTQKWKESFRKYELSLL